MHYENGSYNSDPGSATNAVYYNEKIAISPSDGHIRTSGYVNCGAVIIGKNNDAAGHTYTGYGTAKPKGNVTAILGRVYFQLV